MVCVPEVDLGIDLRSGRSFKEVRGTGQWVAVFLCDLIETSEIDAESERAVFFADKENGSCMGRRGLSDEAIIEVFVEEIPEGLLFVRGKGVEPSYQRRCSFLKLDLQVEGPVRS